MGKCICFKLQQMKSANKLILHCTEFFFFFLYSLVCLFSFKVFYFFSPAERNSCIIRFYVLKISAPVFIYSRALVGLFMQFWSEFFQSRLVAWKYVQLCFKRIWHIVPHSNSMASYKRLQRKKNYSSQGNAEIIYKRLAKYTVQEEYFLFTSKLINIESSCYDMNVIFFQIFIQSI